MFLAVSGTLNAACSSGATSHTGTTSLGQGGAGDVGVGGSGGIAGAAGVGGGDQGGTGGGATQTPPSCTGAPGAGASCGEQANDDCCATSLVPGGKFQRNFDPVVVKFAPGHYATVSPYRLDTYDVSVGRFRAFLDALPSATPAAGAGAHPKVKGSGWQAAWPLGSAQDIKAAIGVFQAQMNGDGAGVSWTDAPGPNETRPMSGVTWFEAFAFCVWDGGRLPTDIELNFAQSGGDEQRVYPWSVPPTSEVVSAEFAVYTGDAGMGNPTHPDAVGVHPKGRGKWGQLDLTGNVTQFVLDSVSNGALPPTCQDCAQLGDPSVGKVLRGGAFDTNAVWAARVDAIYATTRAADAGVRCARNAPLRVPRTPHAEGSGAEDESRNRDRHWVDRERVPRYR
jgi:formylglycine-generating enzyme required for sulfatase activity